MALSGVGLQVLHNRLANIAAEMGLVVMRTAYSPIFNEGLDFCTVLLDSRGRMVAEKNYVPSMMGACVNAVKWTFEEKGAEYFQPGDVVVHNDPYRGGCHLPEHMMMKPIFYEDELVALAGCIGHISEIGGMAPGSFAANARDVYQEGLRLPPVKLLSGGAYNTDLWSVILANHRTPNVTWGDFHAMIGALNIAERRYIELIAKYSLPVLNDGVDRLLDYSEKCMQGEIKALPDGEYFARLDVEDDGVTDQPFHVQASVTITDGKILVDFSGSSKQVAGPMNATYVVALAASYNAVFCIVDPDMLIPRNAGCYRPIEVVAPEGSVVNVSFPGPSVAGNTDLQPKLVDLLLEALLPAAPNRVAANSGGSTNNLLLGGVDPTTGAYTTIYLFDGTGEGASANADGNSAEISRSANCRNTPIEVLENRYPILVLDYKLAVGSSGGGCIEEV